MAVFGRRDGGEGGIDSQLCLGVSPRRRKRRRPKRFRVLSNPTRLLTHPSPQQKTRHKAGLFVSGGEGGIRTLDRGLAYTPLAGERLQPLGHLTKYVFELGFKQVQERRPQVARCSSLRSSSLRDQPAVAQVKNLSAARPPHRFSIKAVIHRPENEAA